MGVFFEDLEVAGKYTNFLSNRANEDVDGSVYTSFFCTFYRCITEISLARQTKKLKYLRRSRPGLKLFVDFMKHGLVNCNHMLLFIQAGGDQGYRYV